MSIASLVALSTAIRGMVAWHHQTPRYFPDEYIYAALGRSLGHGQLQIRGAHAFFPGILEPLIAAPLWRFFDTATAYHLIQVENAFVASLAAIPVYLITRRLGVRTAWAIAAAFYAVAIPSLVLVAYAMSDTVGYTLALAALAAGLASLQEPTRRHQLVFLGFATLASLTRVEYFAVVPAYALAALVVDRRAAFRRHAIAFVALAPAFGVVLLAAFGYYSAGVRQTRVDLNYGKWFMIQPFLLSLEAGVAIVPGAIAGLVGARGRRPVAFASFVGAFALMLIAQATAHAADSLQFKERYLFLLLPLLAPAFALYANDRRRGRWVVCAVALVLFVAAARIPISGYDAATFKSDSQFLLAVANVENWLGIGNTSLVISLLGALCASVAVLTAFTGRLWLAPAVAVAIAVAVSVQASRVDIQTTDSVRSGYPGSLTWVDDATNGRVTAVATPLSPQSDLLTQLWWNQTIQREAVLPHASPTDVFAFTKARVTRTGALAGTEGDLLVDGYGTTAVLANAVPIATHTNFTLWRPFGPPHLRTLIEGRFYDTWLADTGSIRAWPTHPGDAVRATFTLSVPPGWDQAGGVKLGRRALTLAQGRAVTVTCTSAQGGLNVPFASHEYVFRYSGVFRRLSVRLTGFALRDVPAGSARGCTVGAEHAAKA